MNLYYSKKTSNGCKLTEIDIENIRELFKQGENRKTIAKKFKVSYQAILYWTNENIRQRISDYGKSYKKIWNKKNTKVKLKHLYKYRERKKNVFGKNIFALQRLKKEDIDKKIKKHKEKIKILNKLK